MNISTYEARIAALEAQLGPGPGPEPGPVPETGLVSVVVTPDILLSDGTTINEKLGEMLPMASGTKKETFATTADQIPVTTTFNVDIVPGSEWYGSSGVDGEGQPIFGEKGERTSESFTPQNEASRELILNIFGGAASSTDTSDPSFNSARLNILITAPLL